jgi:hypothetical protein
LVGSGFRPSRANRIRDAYVHLSHIDWLEKQIELIDKVGIEDYRQSQMGTHD